MNKGVKTYVTSYGIPILFWGKEMYDLVSFQIIKEMIVSEVKDKVVAPSLIEERDKLLRIITDTNDLEMIDLYMDVISKKFNIELSTIKAQK